jgi:hypothetical protein
MPHLPSVYHEIDKHDSPHDTKIKVKLPKCTGFKFKNHQVNDYHTQTKELATWFLSDKLSWFKFFKKYASEILFCSSRHIEHNGENKI